MRDRRDVGSERTSMSTLSVYLHTGILNKIYIKIPGFTLIRHIPYYLLCFTASKSAKLSRVKLRDWVLQLV